MCLSYRMSQPLNKQSSLEKKEIVHLPVSIILMKGIGYKVKVGCKTVSFTEWSMASKAIKEYWDNPEAAERKYT